MLKKNEHPTFQLTLPISKTMVEFRPFTVKEEKIFMVAFESQNENNIARALSQILNNCIVTPNNFNANDMWLFDFLFLLTKIRCVSVSNISKIIYRDGETNEEIAVDLNLDGVLTKNESIEFDENLMNCTLSDGTIIHLNPLTYNVSNLMSNESTEPRYYLLNRIVQDENVTIVENETKEEIISYIESLSLKDGKLLDQTIMKLPSTLDIKIKYKNSLGKIKEVEIDSIGNFF